MKQELEGYLDHFVKLARRGKRTGASGGEVRACKIAEALLEYASGLDQDAIEGAVLFAMLAHSRPMMAEDVLQGRSLVSA